MLDSRLQARLTQNYSDAAVGYANASVAAMNAFAQQAMNFWLPQARSAPAPVPRRDHLSWFNPSSGMDRTPVYTNPWFAFNPWVAQPVPFRPQPQAPHLMVMASAFAPWAAWWTTAMRGPTFAWPMAYSMMAHGVPDSVAWPAAEANAAVIDAATTITEQAQNTFASYQSAGGFAMAHIWPPKQVVALAALLTPLAFMMPTSSGGPSPFF